MFSVISKDILLLVPCTSCQSVSSLTVKASRKICSRQLSILFFFHFSSKISLDILYESSVTVLQHLSESCFITKTYLYDFDPLKPHFYIVKLGFTGIYIIFLISAQNIDCGYSLAPPHWGGSNEYPQSTFWAEIWKISAFFSENFHFLVVKFSVYLNRHVFLMFLLELYTEEINLQTIVMI